MGNRLFVGNLSWDTDEDRLREFLGDGVRSVRIITDRDSGKSKGFAFADMDSDQLAAAAISKLDGQMLDGRPIRVNEATERARPSNGGGYGGGGGDRGGGQRSSGGSRRRRDTQDSW